jgi:hypothetical protein
VLYSGLPKKDIELVRLALNWPQVEEWQPPENPAKETDSRYAAYAAEYGELSWELDSVEPARLAGLVRDAVMQRMDLALWTQTVSEEEGMRATLNEFVEEYNGRE